MKKNAIIAIFILAGLLVSTQAWAKTGAHARDRERARQARQHGRIAQGVKSGELTKGEVQGLRAQERHIDNARDHALADGKLTGKEKVQLEKAQDRASQNIYDAKHNEIEKS